MDRPALGGFERWNQSASRFELRPLTLDIELRTQACLGSNPGEVQRIPLQSDVLAGDLQAPLKAAQLRIIAGDLRQHADQRVSPGFGSPGTSGAFGGGCNCANSPTVSVCAAGASPFAGATMAGSLAIKGKAA